jgi:phospholipid/cholesterol/gamma-HCH transport system substrate-binding protein
MQFQRNEILTGLLVVGTVAVITGVLILLGAPGLFRPLVTYKIYFDNAAGIKLGAPVLLAGRKIGQVEKLYSPVSREEDQRAQEAAMHPADPNATPAPPDGKPKFEARIDVQVDKNAKVYRDAKPRLFTLGLLGEMAIDFSQGTDASGRAKNGEMFAGERVPDFGEAAAKVLEIIQPVAKEATATMKELETTAQNLNHLTDENSDLTLAIGQFKTFGEHLVDLSAPDSSLSISLKNIEKVSHDLSANNNIEVSLQNLRNSSEKLKSAVNDLGPAGRNIKEFTETVKTQPWRLIWPTTKKYPEKEQAQTAGEQTITVRKSAKTKPKSTPPPAQRATRRE